MNEDIRKKLDQIKKALEPALARNLFDDKKLSKEHCDDLGKTLLAILPEGSSVTVSPEGLASIQLPLLHDGNTEIKKVTLSGRPAELPDMAAAPAPIDPSTGMHKDYWILSDEERAKGFVRPVRDMYRHVGIRPKHVLRDLTPEEHGRYDQFGYVKYEAYPENDDEGCVGRYWTKEQLESGCGTVTRMGIKLAETYARDPKFYGATFCCECGTHKPVGEFTWDGTDELVGS